MLEVSSEPVVLKCKFIVYSTDKPKIKSPDQNCPLSSSTKYLLCSNLDPNSVDNVSL